MAIRIGHKVYVDTVVEFSDEGEIRPLSIEWEDGRKYEIDKVTDVRPAPAMKAGGQGDRYTIWVNGQQSYLFFERYATVTGCNLGRWFVERRVA